MGTTIDRHKLLALVVSGLLGLTGVVTPAAAAADGHRGKSLRDGPRQRRHARLVQMRDREAELTARLEALELKLELLQRELESRDHSPPWAVGPEHRFGRTGHQRCEQCAGHERGRHAARDHHGGKGRHGGHGRCEQCEQCEQCGQGMHARGPQAGPSHGFHPMQPAPPHRPMFSFMRERPGHPDGDEEGDRWDDLAERWRECQEQFEQWRALQAEMIQAWREQQAAWAEQLRAQARELRDHQRAFLEELKERVQALGRDGSHEMERRRNRPPARAQSDGDRQRVVYRVGDRASELYELLAPDYVKVIVSEADDGVAVRGTKREHRILNAALQLLGWIDRDEVFERMTQGQREPRTYRLGRQRAEALYEMLAPEAVKVVVFPVGDEAVTVNATKREHKTLNEFLGLLGWRRDGGLASASGARAEQETIRKRKAVEERKAIQQRKASRKQAKPDKAELKRVVFEVEGRHADDLYDLLAPDDVKAIVSRADEHIAVRGTEFQLNSIRAMLELLNWVPRGQVFEKMVKGQRKSRTYRLGPERAATLFDLLAPGDVKVVVSRLDGAAVSVSATKREHQVIRNFLKVLNWNADAAA